jgi:hypothetical protein
MEICGALIARHGSSLVDPNYIKASFAECYDCRTRKVLIGEKPRAVSSG